MHQEYIKYIQNENEWSLYGTTKISNEKTTMGSVFRSKMVNLVKLSCITNAFLVKSFLQKSILIKFMSRIII